ncbi:hypothetical protein OH77DRAFT_1416079 [Trametes cingulata]|nr:hypothetical protein OH77DRAFT_1416079 [Trametes cingulata]
MPWRIAYRPERRRRLRRRRQSPASQDSADRSPPQNCQIAPPPTQADATNSPAINATGESVGCKANVYVNRQARVLPCRRPVAPLTCSTLLFRPPLALLDHLVSVPTERADQPPTLYVF